MELITSVQNPRVKQWMKLHKRKEREKERLYLIEGPHLVQEAYESQALIRAILLEEGHEIPPWISGTDGYLMPLLIIVTKPVMEKLSETKTPQGIMAVVEMAKPKCTFPPSFMFLMVDRIQDPGNLGTLIRTADAAGFDGVAIGEGSVDLYNSKTIRSTMGSLFHLPVWQAQLPGFIEEMRAAYPGTRVIGTSLQESKMYTGVNYDGPVILVIGNEGSGISEDILAMTDENVIIPLYGRAESLNAAVAGSILMYEAVRQRRKSHPD
ncbi:TrmH family RNA methyltransferase [Aneurinibacillus terranovensis]|uniref:TrmH family RNA methyltransferase n=1 Tax=Aneurinibacillus terranovensis TaxID=278991 RepID=UPI0004146255|nr:RNA methyltransferase [Aneurinibacillus terranovensis]